MRTLAIIGSCAALASGVGLLALPASAPALGLPNTFPRAIVITGTGQGVRVTQFTAATRAAGSKKVRVTVRVTAARIGATPTALTVAVGPCTRGTATSPLCKPAATSKVTLTAVPASVTRTFTVARPAAKADALRITLTAAGKPIPYKTSNVGGGGGTAELLLNGGTWRFHQGTAWGLVGTSPADLTLDHVLFNSRRYEWNATSQAGAVVTTTFGYADAKPAHTYKTTLKPGVPYRFYHTGNSPVESARTAPRVIAYDATIGTQPLFKVRMPLAAWNPVTSTS
ncbi:MAG TPA: hypothetical protein VMT10_14315 [Solirubrobacteraceae bacterium]|nr:hypothetical protein [Solirubrobacteraceae bacterium]